FPVPTAGSDPKMIALGPDGRLWFTENGANKIGRVDRLGSFQEFTIPTPDSQPFGITSGPDGNIWFTENAATNIGRATPSGVITEYAVPRAVSGPSDICTGPDGNIWFTENAAGKIGKLVLHVAGDVNGDGGASPADVFFLINFLFAGGPAPK